jgi:hypothetical protein
MSEMFVHDVNAVFRVRVRRQKSRFAGAQPLFRFGPPLVVVDPRWLNRLEVLFRPNPCVRLASSGLDGQNSVVSDSDPLIVRPSERVTVLNRLSATCGEPMMEDAPTIRVGLPHRSELCPRFREIHGPKSCDVTVKEDGPTEPVRVVVRRFQHPLVV